MVLNEGSLPQDINGTSSENKLSSGAFVHLRLRLRLSLSGWGSSGFPNTSVIELCDQMAGLKNYVFLWCFHSFPCNNVFCCMQIVGHDIYYILLHFDPYSWGIRHINWSKWRNMKCQILSKISQKIDHIFITGIFPLYILIFY